MWPMNSLGLSFPQTHKDNEKSFILRWCFEFGICHGHTMYAKNFRLRSFWIPLTQAVHETHGSKTLEHLASRVEFYYSTDCSKYMFVLYHNCSAFKSNSTTISAWLFFIHLNRPHFTECFIWEILSLCLNGFKANLPQIFPSLPQLHILSGNATALTEKSEARKPSLKCRHLFSITDFFGITKHWIHPKPIFPPVECRVVEFL